MLFLSSSQLGREARGSCTRVLLCWKNSKLPMSRSFQLYQTSLSGLSPLMVSSCIHHCSKHLLEGGRLRGIRGGMRVGKEDT